MSKAFQWPVFTLQLQIETFRRFKTELPFALKYRFQEKRNHGTPAKLVAESGRQPVRQECLSPPDSFEKEYSGGSRAMLTACGHGQI